MVGKRMTLTKRASSAPVKKAVRQVDEQAEQDAKVQELLAKQVSVASICATTKSRRRLFQRFAQKSNKPDFPETPVRCPECDYIMSPTQVEEGFLEDPFEYTTCCPECEHRFMTWMLLNVTKRQRDLVVRLCEDQTKEAVRRWIEEEDFEGNNDLLSKLATKPMLIWNILYHGSGANVLSTLSDWFPDENIQDELPELSESSDDESSKISSEWE